MNNLRIDQIKIGNRFRKDLGDLEALAESIKSLGLLQPIGVDFDYNLIFGERRLRACQLLGWTEVPVVFIDLTNPLQAEHDENEVRKDFTPSERVAIARAIEEKLGNRQGQRTDIQLPQNFGEVNKGKETAEIAAEKAGFGNPETYRQAKHVVDNAPSEVIEQMDQGQLSINKAYQVTKQLDQLPEEQRGEVIQIIAANKDAINSSDLTDEQQKQLRRMERFKTNLDRLIERLNTLSQHSPHEYFDGLDYVEWAFSKITIFAEAHLEAIDDAIAWLTEFRKEYARRMLTPGAPVELRRVK